MKLGILDAVPDEFYRDESVIRDTQRFIMLLESVGFQWEMVSYHVAIGEFPTSTAACDAYLITGSPASVYDNLPWIEQLKGFIRQLHAEKRRLVGICFGHQVIAEALGGKVIKSPRGWMAGMWRFDLLEQPDWMPDPLPEVKIYHLNQDQVLDLPPDAVHAGQSAMCPNTMYFIGDHILGIQGHPELPLDALQGYIDQLSDVLTAPVVEQATRSFNEGAPDSLLVGHWIRQFIER